MQQKNFKFWHPVKEEIHRLAKAIYVYPREIWQCSLGVNIGVEQDGKGNESLRPVLVIKRFNHNMAWCIPLTTVVKKGDWYVKIN
jgi:mRNA interferase MazF